MLLRLLEIADKAISENFRALREALENSPILAGNWRFIEVELGGAVTNYAFPHSLGFIPKDILQTSKTGTGTLTWSYEAFTRDHLILTTTGPCKVRAFVGSYQDRGRR